MYYCFAAGMYRFVVSRCTVDILVPPVQNMICLLKHLSEELQSASDPGHSLSPHRTLPWILATRYLLCDAG